MNFRKWRVYAALSAACLLLVLTFTLNRWQIDIEIEETPPTVSPPATDVTPTSLTSSSTAEPKPTKAIASAENNSPQANNTPAKPVKAPSGALRLSNRTGYPVRIAFLGKRPGTKSAKMPVYGNPAHWDFAPGEGANKGLILSLPSGLVKLEKGDVLVAFAQDGSGRYWGPYIVGETSAPGWDDRKSEWHLILQ